MSVGMPAILKLNMFGEFVMDYFREDSFGGAAYHVGSSLTEKSGWRDVDVRVLLKDERYEAQYGDPKDPHGNKKWVAICLAFSALGREMTGLPIDFQVQHMSYANEQNKGKPRSALLCPWRFTR